MGEYRSYGDVIHLRGISLGLQRWGIKVLIAVGLLSVSACAPFSRADADGTLHYYVIGFGVVSVPAANNQNGVTAVSHQAVGLTIIDHPGMRLNFGYSQGVVTTVAPGAEDVRVAVSAAPGGVLTVDAESAVFAGSDLGERKSETSNKGETTNESQ